MATTSKDFDAVAQIAGSLGIASAKLDAMPLAEVRSLIESDDIDPASKACIVLARLSKFRGELDVVDEFLRQQAGVDINSEPCDRRSEQRSPARPNENADRQTTGNGGVVRCG